MLNLDTETLPINERIALYKNNNNQIANIFYLKRQGWIAYSESKKSTYFGRCEDLETWCIKNWNIRPGNLLIRH